MKVTFIAREYPPNIYGGAGVHLRELARCLSELMDVEVRCFGKQRVKKKHLLVKGYFPKHKVRSKYQPKFDSDGAAHYKVPRAYAASLLRNDGGRKYVLCSPQSLNIKKPTGRFVSEIVRVEADGDFPPIILN